MGAKNVDSNSKRRVVIAISCLSLAVTLIVLRFLSMPLSARQVVQRSFDCYDRKDSGCLISLSLSEEAEANGVSVKTLGLAIDKVQAKLPSSAKPIGSLDFIDIEQQGAKATRKYVSQDGASYSVTFTARRTEKGYLLENIMVSILVSPLLTVSQKTEPLSLQGFDKIRRLRQIAEFGQDSLEPIGIRGLPEYGDLGLRVRSWREMIGKYDAGLSAQGISPLDKL